MKYKVVLLSLLILLIGSAVQATEQEIPFHMPVPDGWRTETIPFPLEFAPELAYQGLEELRFSPGMFTPAAEDFWTYAFVWWVSGSTSFDAEALQIDLNAYFTGLAYAVAKSKGHILEGLEIQSHITPLSGKGSTPLVFEGTVDAFDPFVTMSSVSLNLRAELIVCKAQDRVALFFELSPLPTSHQIWNTLQGIRNGFQCSQ